MPSFSAARPFNLITALALMLAIWSFSSLQTARALLSIDHVMLTDTPATFYSAAQPSGDKAFNELVVVAHGFGGSRQMMEAISLSLARAGYSVVAFDFIGHGRHAKPLSPAIETLTGTTQDLVDQTLRVVRDAKRRTGLKNVSFVGHSMATDVVVRAAQELETTQSVVAISMYSDAVSPTHPERLLVVSGALESRLRAVALDTVSQVGLAQEGVTVTSGNITRRAVSAPMVGHVGVLWSSLTLSEIPAWLGMPGQPVSTGMRIATLMVSIVILFRTVVQVLPVTAPHTPISTRRAILAGTVAAVAAGGVGITGLPLIGFAGFGALGLAFAVWGVVVLWILRPPLRLSRPDLFASLLLVGWGLGLFAVALDQYGAAFVPTGPRLSLAQMLLPATLVFGLADRILVQGRGVVARFALRLPFLVAFTVAMFISPTELGLVFTVLPVLVLFWLVYGTMAMWVANRTGWMGAGLGLGVILAWSIAASTPLFMA